MKKTTLILAALLGQIVSGYGADIVINNDTNGPVNQTTSEAYTIDNNVGDSIYATNVSVSAEDGKDVFIDVRPSGNLSALGTGGIRSTGAGHSVSVQGASIAGSLGGTMTTATDIIAGGRILTVNGGNGMYLENTDLDMSNTTVSGGDGGTLNVDTANNASSANGGIGIRFEGANTMTATSDTKISGGNGGYVNNLGNASTGHADGGAGIQINASAVDLNLSSDTTVSGGAGGVVTRQRNLIGTAIGGAGILVTGGSTVTIDGGIYQGGKGGQVAGVTQADGAALEIQSSIVTIADGTFVGGILLSSGSSTLSLQKTYTNDAAITQTAGIVTFDEWYGGQLQDVSVSAGAAATTMKFNFNGTNAFNLDGVIKLAGTTTSKKATIEFNSGLVVKSGGILDLGKFSEVKASNAVTESNSTIRATRDATTVSKISSTGTIVVENGTKWIIDDVGTSGFDVGQEFTLASGGSISNNLDSSNVLYVGKNGSSGWLGLITDVYVNNADKTLRAVYGQKEINEVLGVVGDTSDFGLAMADLSLLVPQTNTNVYENLGDVTHFLDEARVIMTNGYVRTPEVAHAMIGLQAVFADQIRDRTHSNLNQMEVGYPTSPAPNGAAGWSWLRDFSDRVEGDSNWLRGLSDRRESGISTDGLRSFSDRAEGVTEGATDKVRGMADRTEDALGYNKVEGAMNSISTDLPLEDIALPPEWQVWGRGYGSTIEQESRGGIAGYDASIGGGIVGIDKRINNVLMGLGGGYARTTLRGNSSNDAEVDTGNVVAYLAAHGSHVFFDINVNGALNKVDTTMQELGYTSSYDAFSAGLYVGGGFALALNKYLLLTPDASLLTTYYSHDSYSETSSLGLPTKVFDSYNQVSPLSTVGATLSLIQKIDLSGYEMAIQPEIRGHWLHDFNAELDNETYIMAGGDYTINTPLMATEEDLYRVGAGVRCARWSSDSTEIGLDVDYTFGKDYDAYIISGKLMHRF